MKYSYNTIIGPITIYESRGLIKEICFKEVSKDKDYKETYSIYNCFEQISKYLDGKLKVFTVPFEITGSSFEKKVYKSLVTIPYGQTKSYKDIAISIGNPRAYRAVGLANKKILYLC